MISPTRPVVVSLRRLRSFAYLEVKKKVFEKETTNEISFAFLNRRCGFSVGLSHMPF
jgi:hypothetical protein